MRDFVTKIRNHTAMQFAAPVVKDCRRGRSGTGSWAFSSHRRDFDPKTFSCTTRPCVPEIPNIRLHQKQRRAAALT
jgi:hypothetical protein